MKYLILINSEEIYLFKSGELRSFHIDGYLLNIFTASLYQGVASFSDPSISGYCN